MERLRILIRHSKSQKGQLLVEVLFAIALTSIILPALLTGLISSRQSIPQQRQRIQATALLKEAEEVVRNVRNQSWANIATDGTYHPQISGSRWSLVSGVETVGYFQRSIQISSIERDSNGSIVTSGGTVDPSTKRVFINITWTTPLNSSVNSTMYLTRYSENAVDIVDTFNQFNTGNNNQTTVVNNDDGEIELGAGGGGGDWCNPSLSVTNVNLSRQGIPTAVSAIEGSVVTGTGGNASGPTFVRTNITGNNPPIATFAGEYDNSKTNGVFVEGNYGYIATDSNSEEIKILDMTRFTDPPTNSKFLKVGYVNTPGNTQGDSIFVKGNYGYVTSVNRLYVVDLTSKSGSRPILNPTGVLLAGIGEKVVVVGNYAYVAVLSSSNPLQIIDISNPASPSVVAQASVASKTGVDITVNSTGTRAYLITPYVDSSWTNVLIFNTTTKSGTLPQIGTGYVTGGMDPEGVSLTTGNRLIVVGTGGQEYQVLNIANEASPTLCGSLNITNGAYGVSSILQTNGYAYSYVVTGDTNAEMKIVLGGSGGTFSNNGTFTSAPFDAGNSVVFNSFIPTYVEPAGTSIQFQVAVAQPVNNNCTDPTYTFVGPDGTTSSFYNDEGAIPFNSTGTFSNPGRCFKFKAYLSTTDQTATPILYDATVNYSP